MIGPRGPMPGTAQHGAGCPCDRCNREKPVLRVVRCTTPDCEAVAEREVFEGEATDPCGFCGSRDVEAA